MSAQGQFNYETPMGSFTIWEDAAAACERADLDPCTCIKYVGVPSRGPVDVSWIHEYGMSQKLSNSVRVF